jgi:hypothetical protein
MDTDQFVPEGELYACCCLLAQYLSKGKKRCCWTVSMSDEQRARYEAELAKLWP